MTIRGVDVLDKYVEITLGGLTLGMTILGGMFVFLWNGLTKLRDDQRSDISENRQEQQKIWSEMRLAEIRANEYRARVEGRLGQLPTREEMKAGRDELRQDLRDMEGRLRDVVHNSGNHV